MLQAYLIPIEEAALVSFGLGILLLIPICVLHYRRFGYVMPSRAIVFYSFLFYSLSAIFLVSLPLPTVTPDFCEVHTVTRQLQLTPFQFVPDIIAANQITLRHFNVISILESPVFLQAFFNFLLLMPLGVFLWYYFRTGWKLTLTIALTTTAMFELSQITGLFWTYPCPYRTFDVDDLMLNATGAMLGYWVTPYLAHYLPNLQERYTHPFQVSVFRRCVAFTIDWFLANSLSRLIFAILGTNSTHPLWLDLSVYAVWFIAVPYYCRGQTLGKAIVNIQVVSQNGHLVRVKQLYLRYGLLIALPVLTDYAFTTWTNHQLLTPQQYIGNWLTTALLGLLLLEVWAIIGLMLIRKDHRGIHDLVANTRHQITTYLIPSNPQS